jgi:hypothetical protein
MNIEHFVCLSWFRAISGRHEQDGKTLSLAYQSIRESERASCDPAMAARTLPGAGGGPMPPSRFQCPAALIAVGAISVYASLNA